MPVLNTTATADISFMLLTFFLVTTSMDVDRGLVRQLPSLDDEHEKHNDFVEVERENTMAFVIDSKGKPIRLPTTIPTLRLRMPLWGLIPTCATA